MMDRINGKNITRSLSPAPSRGRSSDGGDNRGRGRSPAAAPRGGRGRSLSPQPHNTTQSKAVQYPPDDTPEIKICGPPNLLDHGYGNLPLSMIPEHEDDDEFLVAVKRCIPSEFILIASQDDVSQAQEDFYGMDHFKLKPPDGRSRWLNSELAGSVATCALLQLMYENPKAMVAPSTDNNTNPQEEEEEVIEPWSTLGILQEIQQRIKTCSHQDANPTISSSRPLGPPRFEEGVYAPYYIVPPNFTKGTRRALLIGCVSGGDNVLRGTLNDVNSIQRFLVDHCGFETENIVALTESNRTPAHLHPTKQNIVDGFAKLILESREGDVNFIQFSGHGSRSDTNLYILPCDYKENGYIMDDRILKNLIKAMPAGVYTTMLVDCCYSGTVCDLPYMLKPWSSEQEIEGHFDTSVSKKQSQPQPSTTTNSRPARPMIRQSVQSFYNLDNLAETLEKEAKGGDEYQQLENARKQKRAWMQFEPKTLIEWNKTMAHKTKEGFVKGVVAVGQVAQDATERAIEATAHASDKVIDVTKKTTARLRSLSPVPSGRGRRTTTDEDINEKKSSVERTTTREQKRSKSPVRVRRFDDDIPSPNKKTTTKPRSLSPVPRRLDDNIPSPNKKPATRQHSKSPVPRRLDDDIPSPSKKNTTTRQRSKSPVRGQSGSNDTPSPSKTNATKNGEKTSKSEAIAPVKPNNNSSTNQPKSSSPAAAISGKPSTGATIPKGTKSTSPEADNSVKPPTGATSPNRPKSTSPAATFPTIKPPTGARMPKPSPAKGDEEEEEALTREFEKAASKAAKERRKQDQETTDASAPYYDWKLHQKNVTATRVGNSRVRSKSAESRSVVRPGKHPSNRARSKSPSRRL